MDRDAWDERYRSEDMVWSAEPNRFLVEVVTDLTPGSALDLATGEGRNAVWLALQGWEVHAVDWSDVGLDKARELAQSAGVDVWFTRADLREWWPPSESYDLVVVAYLQIPHLERQGVWRSAAQAVRTGGHLVLIGHDRDNLEHGYGGPARPDVLYTAAEAADVLGRSLEVVRAEQVRRPVTTDEGEFEAIDNVVVARRSEA
jgi:SAM-dependent methyltransferase